MEASKKNQKSKIKRKNKFKKLKFPFLFYKYNYNVISMSLDIKKMINLLATILIFYIYINMIIYLVELINIGIS